MAERKRDEMSTSVTTPGHSGGGEGAAVGSAPGAPKRPARPAVGVDRDALRDKVMAKFPNIRARLAESPGEPWSRTG